MIETARVDHVEHLFENKDLLARIEKIIFIIDQIYTQSSVLEPPYNDLSSNLPLS